MSAPELKPCPFCGTSLEDDSHPGSTVEGGGFTFECGKCGANWPRMTRAAMDGLDDEGIASFFNSRADLPPGYAILSPDGVRGIRDEAKAEGLEEAADYCWSKRDLLADAEKKQIAAGLTGRDYYGRRLEAELLSRAIRSLKGGRDAQ